MPKFSPRLDVLPAAQRRLWAELAAVPSEFVLYGGTALALHLGHRDSIDFDFFGNRPLNVPELEGGLIFLAGARIIQRDKNTLSATVDRGGDVRVSFSGVPNMPRLAPPHLAEDSGLQVASLLDLAGTKASVLQMRAEAKDYIDMDALLSLGKIDLPMALASAQKLYGSAFNPEITLKALSYFDDGDLRTLPEDMKIRLVTAARDVDLERLPDVYRAVPLGCRAGVRTMKPIPITDETLSIARRVIWFETPEKALADPVRFMAYAMTYALPEDMRAIRRHVSDDDFRGAIDHAPAGIIDPRSWAYWNSKMGRYPPPPQPVRRFGVAEGEQPPLSQEGRNGVAGSAQNGGLEEQRRYGRMAWLRMREQQPRRDPEEIRRRARESWRAKYGPKQRK